MANLVGSSCKQVNIEVPQVNNAFFTSNKKGGQPKVFDRFQETQARTFVIKRKHFQSLEQKCKQSSPKDEQKSKLVLQQKSMKNQFTQIPYIMTENSGRPSVKISSKEREQNVEIIKRMLQANTSRNRVSHQERKHLSNNYDNFSIFPQVNFPEKNLSSRKKKGLSFNAKIEETSLISKSRYKNVSVVEKAKKKEFANISQKSGNKSQSEVKIKRKKELEYQKLKIDDAFSLEKDEAEKKTNRKKTKLESNKTEENQSPQKCKFNTNYDFESYISFISGSKFSPELTFNFNFMPLRKMSSTQAWKKFRFGILKVVEGIIESLQTNIESESNEKIQKIQNDCKNYFKNEERAEMQIILKEHYFKLFKFKIDSIFVYERICIYFCFLLCQTDKLNEKWYRVKTKEILACEKNILSTLFNLVQQPTISKHHLKSKTKNPISCHYVLDINQSFETLKMVSEIESNLFQLQKLFYFLLKDGEIPQFNDVFRFLKSYTKDEPYGLATRSYENLMKTQMVLSWKYLSIPPIPFLPPIKSCFKYTIFLELDQTIIYLNQENNTLKYRPYLDTFFKKLEALKFEIVIFSTSARPFVDAMVGEIERKRRIFEYRLFQEHLSSQKGALMKNLNKVGRSLQKTIIVDKERKYFSNCAANGIEVSKWYGDKSDRQLLVLLSILSSLQNIEEGSSLDLRQLIEKDKKILSEMLAEPIQKI